jgi:hypothetical protein
VFGRTAVTLAVAVVVAVFTVVARRRPVNIPNLVLPVLSLVPLRYHKVLNWKWNFRISRHSRLLAVAVAAAGAAVAPAVNPDV